MTSIPSPAAAAATSAHRRALTSLRRIPAIEEEPRDHRVEPDALDGDLVGLDAAAATPPAGAGGEDGGSPVARENPGRSFPGRAQLAGEPSPEARRGHRRRRARRGSPLLVELGEVAGEG